VHEILIDPSDSQNALTSAPRQDAGGLPKKPMLWMPLYYNRKPKSIAIGYRHRVASPRSLPPRKLGDIFYRRVARIGPMMDHINSFYR